MKITIASLLKFDGPTGVQTHVREVRSYLAANQTEVKFISPQGGSFFERLFLGVLFVLRKILSGSMSDQGVQLYRYGHGLVLTRILKRTLASGDSCMIYAQCPVSARAAYRARKGAGQKIVLVIHFCASQADELTGLGLIDEQAEVFASIRRMEAEVLPLVNGIVFVSNFARSELLRINPGLETTPYRVLPNFLTFSQNLMPYREQRRGLICIGSLERNKNQCYALEIVSAAKRLGRPIELTLIGDGPERAALESLAHALDVEANVRFLGYVSQAANLLGHYRAYLHVAKAESFGIVLIEAMSQGLPIFAPAIGGIPEILSSDVEGRFIPLGNAEHAAQIILDWIETPGSLDRAAVAARQTFVDRFSSSVVGPKLVEFFNCTYIQ